MFDTTIQTDLSRACALLERLVQAIERLSPPPDPAIDSFPVHQSTLDDLHTIDDETQERAKQEGEDLAARYGVVYNSPAFQAAMRDYEQEMRRIHGKDTAVDWDEAFTEADAIIRGPEGPGD